MRSIQKNPASRSQRGCLHYGVAASVQWNINLPRVLVDTTNGGTMTVC